MAGPGSGLNGAADGNCIANSIAGNRIAATALNVQMITTGTNTSRIDFPAGE